MKYILSLLLLLSGIILSAQTDNEIRKIFQTVNSDPENISNLYHALKSSKNNSKTVRFYHAALMVMNAKNAFWPTEKLKLANDGMDLLDNLVLKYPEDMEIRWLRMIIEKNAPSFLQRNHVKEDLTIVSVLLSKPISTEIPKSHLLFIVESLKKFQLISSAMADNFRLIHNLNSIKG